MVDSPDKRAAELQRKIKIARHAEDLAVVGFAEVAGDNRDLVRGRVMQAAHRARLVQEPLRRQAVRQIFKEHQRAVISHEVTGPVLTHVEILEAAYGSRLEDYWHAELAQTRTVSELAEWLAAFCVAAGERGRNDRQQQILKALEGCHFKPALYPGKLTIFWLAANPNTWDWLPWTLLRYVAQQPAQTVPPKFSDVVEAAISSKEMRVSHVSRATSTAPPGAAPRAPESTATPSEGTPRTMPPPETPDTNTPALTQAALLDFLNAYGREQKKLGRLDIQEGEFKAAAIEKFEQEIPQQVWRAAYNRGVKIENKQGRGAPRKRSIPKNSAD